MDLDGFWTIIESADGDTEAITEALQRLPLTEIADFAQIQDGLEFDAYREDLWLACVLINGGFGSDDGFLYFRDWLILQGREVYEAALSNPDSLAGWPEAVAITAQENDFADREDFLYVANDAWETITGEEEGLEAELESRGFEAMRDRPVAPAGEQVPFKDRQRVSAILPRLTELFYDRAARLRGH